MKRASADMKAEWKKAIMGMKAEKGNTMMMIKLLVSHALFQV
jgi:hypothetical protein